MIVSPPAESSAVAIGLGTGSIAVVAALVVLLSHYQVVHAAEDRLPVERLLTAVVLPLAFVFATILIDRALSVT